MNQQSRADALAWAEEQFPLEACGLIVVVEGTETFWKCRNISSLAGDQFILSPQDYAAAETAGEVIGVFHSHINLPPTPSDADRASCEATGLRWHIVGLPTGAWAELEPCGFKAPLVGRVHAWNSLDCWTLVKDWYQATWGIGLISVPRWPNFWRDGIDILGDNVQAAGFRDLTENEKIETGDVLLFQTADSPFPNHVGVMISGDTLLHHAENRLSSRDVYGGWFKKHTVRVVRHENRPTSW
jgi:proteasome lid subunit RPN8/RPN11